MTAIYRQMTADDLLTFNQVQLDRWTETYGAHFYLHYLMTQRPYCVVAEHPCTRQIMAYIIGKVEGTGDNYHGHITAVSVAAPFRRERLATALMGKLERAFDACGCKFVDLFVRPSNVAALRMYEKLGYVVYRRILEYYASDGGDEDGLDMRKSLSSDPDRRCMMPLEKPVKLNDAGNL